MKNKDFTKRVMTVHRQLGGRATADEVWLHLRAITDRDEQKEFLRKGALSDIRSALRSKDPETGLPLAPAVGAQYVQAELLLVEDYAWLITGQAKSARQATARMAAYQRECEQRHGVFLDIAAAEEIATRGRNAS